jgi:hypothetical protein
MVGFPVSATHDGGPEVAATAVQPTGVAGTYADSERTVFGVLMIAAPILMLGAAIFHPPHGIESGSQYYHAAHDHSTAFYIAHTCFFLSAVLFVPTMVALGRMVQPSHPKGAFWGCVLSLMGFVGWGALDGIDYMTWVAGKPDAGLDEATMIKFIEAALASSGILIPVLAVFTLLPIGLCVLAYGLIKASVVPAWVAWLMPIGIIGIAGTLQYTVLLILSALALLASFGYVGVSLLRTPKGAPAQAAPAPA